jgi:hypothetical protein
MLARDAWHLLAAIQGRTVAEHALVLLRQRPPLGHARRVGRCGGRRGRTGGSVPMKSEKPRMSSSVMVLATAVIASLLRRPSRNRNSCVMAYSDGCRRAPV